MFAAGDWFCPQKREDQGWSRVPKRHGAGRQMGLKIMINSAAGRSTWHDGKKPSDEGFVDAEPSATITGDNGKPMVVRDLFARVRARLRAAVGEDVFTSWFARLELDHRNRVMGAVGDEERIPSFFKSERIGLSSKKIAGRGTRPDFFDDLVGRVFSCAHLYTKQVEAYYFAQFF